MRCLISFICLSCFFNTHLRAQEKAITDRPIRVFDYSWEGTDSYGTYLVKLKKGESLPSDVKYKYSSNGWDYILTDRETVLKYAAEGLFTQLYIEPGKGHALNDSSLVTHNIIPIHQGIGNLPDAYTGQGVIIGYIDTGLDVTHNDFKDEDGNSRVLRYWDQGAATNSRTPEKYGYGQVFDSTDINAGILPNYAGSGHGTTVAGAGSGNGLANGTNKGVAPNSNIVVVKSNLNATNWSMTVAEGVDYIFGVADEYNMPVVANLSVGTYRGSHDAKDPAGIYIDSLLNEKEGRIVVCSAGNSGSLGKYHVRANVTEDTSFVWLIPRTNVIPGYKGVYLEVWSDTTDAKDIKFALGVDAPGPIYRGRTDFFETGIEYGADQIHPLTIDDNLIGTFYYLEDIVGPNYFLRFFMFSDSLTYRFRFMTTGSGNYDAWSSSHSTIGLTDFETTIPNPVDFPDFEFYVHPDTLQTIVNSWACSEQVITVANMQNRQNYIDFSGNIYPTDGGLIPSGQLSAGSSKGPNRKGLLKPDITAAGDLTLSARVMNESYLTSQLDQGGLHVRNGGTSMAAPVVAGIAALYLEKCPRSTWEDFKTDLLSTAKSDEFTGTLPNYGFGMGKADGLATLLQSNFVSNVIGEELLCNTEGQLTVEPTPVSIEWNTLSTDFEITVAETGEYFASVYNEIGCKGLTDTLLVVAGTYPNQSYITNENGVLFASANVNYQWHLGGEAIDGATEQEYTPTENGEYSVSSSHESGCETFSDSETVTSTVSLTTHETATISLFPNPVKDSFTITTDEKGEYSIYTTDGQLIKEGSYTPGDKISISNASKGVYLLQFRTNNIKFETKLLKN
jgi:hypothetical protein